MKKRPLVEAHCTTSSFGLYMSMWSVSTHNDLYCVLHGDLSSVQQGHSVLLNCYLLIVLVTVKSINTLTKGQETFKAA